MFRRSKLRLKFVSGKEFGSILCNVFTVIARRTRKNQPYDSTLLNSKYMRIRMWFVTALNKLKDLLHDMPG